MANMIPFLMHLVFLFLFCSSLSTDRLLSMKCNRLRKLYQKINVHRFLFVSFDLEKKKKKG